jgi:hypothetical protein
MVPAPCASARSVRLPAYHCAQAKVGFALHLDARTLIPRLHLLALCRVAPSPRGIGSTCTSSMGWETPCTTSSTKYRKEHRCIPAFV